MKLNLKSIKIIIFFLAIAELLSLIAYFNPNLGFLIFLIFIAFAFIVSILDLRFGIWLVLAELLISSKGYLFILNIGGLALSVRIALWLVVISVWLAKFISDSIKNKKLTIDFRSSSYFSAFFVLFIFIAWGLVNGFLSGNDFGGVFLDFNAWLFFALAFPVYSAVRTKGDLAMLWNIFIAAAIWLCIKTLAIIFLFSHETPYLPYLYKWVRDTGVGEITRMSGKFYRIFFQSHIFVLAAFFAINAYMISHLHNNLKAGRLFIKRSALLLMLFISSIIISFSRSYWAGLFIGTVFLTAFAIFIFRKNIAGIMKLACLNLLGVVLSILLILIVIKFPYPKPSADFSTGDLTDRVANIANEPGASSRWALLPVLWDKITEDPMLGKGFGTTVTYQTSDPRILEIDPSGNYTTYAFEWGWLDLWLKLGLFGLLSYIFLIGYLIADSFNLVPAGWRMKNKSPQKPEEPPKTLLNLINFFSINKSVDFDGRYFKAGIGLGLIVLCAVSVFSPYMNHPLGIGYILLAAVSLDRMRAVEN